MTEEQKKIWNQSKYDDIRETPLSKGEYSLLYLALGVGILIIVLTVSAFFASRSQAQTIDPNATTTVDIIDMSPVDPVPQDIPVEGVDIQPDGTILVASDSFPVGTPLKVSSSLGVYDSYGSFFQVGNEVQNFSELNKRLIAMQKLLVETKSACAR